LKEEGAVYGGTTCSPTTPLTVILSGTYPQTVEKCGISVALWASLWTSAGSMMRISGLRKLEHWPLRQKVPISL
jgi:hypothetical protein